MDERCCGVLAVQSPQGQHDAGGGADVSVAEPGAAQRAASAQERPAVPTELPAPELDGLSLLGHRARSVGSAWPDILLVADAWPASRRPAVACESRFHLHQKAVFR